MPEVQVLPPDMRTPEPALDDDQRVVAETVARQGRGNALVVGAPGCGKTTLAVALAVEAVASGRHAPERVVVVAPTRLAADVLGDRIGAATGGTSTARRAATPASLAWGILRSAAVSAGRPSPVLLSGSESDDVIRRLLTTTAGMPGGTPDWSGIVPAAATSLPGFRAELRDLLMRAEEAGLGPADLERAGREHGRPEWVAAASIFRAYEANLALRTTALDQPDRFDASAIVAAAADLLAAGAGGSEAPWDLIIVDDAQDITRAAWDLLRVLARDGAQVVLIGNADESVQGYRGAVPHVIARADLDPPLGLAAHRFDLRVSHRVPPVIGSAVAVVADRIGVARGFEARGLGAPADDATARALSGADGVLEVLVSSTVTAEARALAARFRRLHRGVGGPTVAWSDVAVIARSRSRAAEVRSSLAAAGIPCAALGDALPLHRHPAVAPLVALARVALGEAWTSERAEEVLSSRLIALDGLALRRIRRQLVAEERTSGGTRLGDALLLEALAAAQGFATLPGADARRAARAADAVAAGARAAARPGASAAEVLWAAWDALALSEVWRTSAVAGSAIDDAALDAVIALFRAAARYAERLPDAPPLAFLDHLESEEFAADSLAPHAAPRDVVAIETPASAAGREWEVVAVVGLEDGSWPNLRLRDSILGATHLADVLSGRDPVGPGPRGATVEERLRSARAGVIDDELRALTVALTRAKRVVIACAVDNEEARPSRFLSLLGWTPPEGSDEGLRPAVTREEGLADLRDAVVSLRAEAEILPSDRRTGHVAAIARLALAGVAGADPATWGGARAPSSGDPLWPVERPVRVSPSRVEAVEECPLRAVLQAVGGSRPATDAQLLGTVLHRAAALHPTGSVEEVDAEIEAVWATLDAPPTWAGRRLRERARAMAEAYVAYAEGVAADGWDVQTEVPFSVEAAGAVVSGRADRVHVRGDAARIADLKTGTTSVTKRAAAQSGQLAMYQLAAALGAFPNVGRAEGAELVLVGTDSPGVRTQGPIDEAAAAARLASVASTLACHSFEAHTGAACRTCPVARSCPAVPEGGQVSES